MVEELCFDRRVVTYFITLVLRNCNLHARHYSEYLFVSLYHTRKSPPPDYQKNQYPYSNNATFINWLFLLRSVPKFAPFNWSTCLPVRQGNELGRRCQLADDVLPAAGLNSISNLICARPSIIKKRGVATKHTTNCGSYTILNQKAMLKLSTAIAVLNGLATLSHAQKTDNETLVLCDCGIGDNKDQPSWSTSRQMNWYKSLLWPDSVSKYPAAPEMAVEVPFGNGIYPWNPAGATETMPNGDVWSVYIEEQTPEGFKAGNAVHKDGETLNCWSYHGRPVSAAINKTANHDAICWSAFVCDSNSSPPERPSDMTPTTTSPSTTAPSTSDFTQQPAPTESSSGKVLSVDAAVSPRFINWPNNWDAFINNFVWDQITGNCVGGPFRGDGYTMTFECSGVQIDSDTHMTLQLIKALHDVGTTSLWFNQNPIIPGTNGSTNGTIQTPSWVVMPESFSLTATDAAAQTVLGNLSYTTKYDTFLTNPCSSCETARFNAEFFNPILEAMKGTFPEYNNYHVQAVCDPWVVCF